MPKPSWLYERYYTEKELLQRAVGLIDHHYTDEEILNDFRGLHISAKKTLELIELAKVRLGIAELI